MWTFKTFAIRLSLPCPAGTGDTHELFSVCLLGAICANQTASRRTLQPAKCNTVAVKKGKKWIRTIYLHLPANMLLVRMSFGFDLSTKVF